MKYLKVILLSVGVVIILGFIGAIVALNSDSVHRNVEAKLASAAGGDVHLGRFGWAFPLRLSVGPSEIKTPRAEINFDQASLSVTRFIPPFGVDIKVDHPRVTLPESPGQAPPPEPPPAAGTDRGGATGGGAPVPPLKISFRVRDGEITAAGAVVTALDLDFAQPRLLDGEARLRVDAFVRAGPLPAPVPLHLETDLLEVTPARVASREINARVAGVVAKVAGASDLAVDHHVWELHADAPSLAAVPPPSAEVKAWSGTVKADIKVSKDKLNIDADGEVRAKDVRTELRVSRDGATAEGELSANLDAGFGYHGLKLDVPRAVIHVNADQVAVRYQNQFTKPRGTPLALALELKSGPKELFISRLEARLSELRLTGGGRASVTAPFEGHVDLNVAPVALSGLKPLAPALAQVPADGILMFKGALDGPLGSPAKVRLRLEKAALDGPLGALSVNGIVSELTLGPKLDVHVSANPLKLGAARAFAPDLKDVIPDGEVRARVNLGGRVAKATPWFNWPLAVSGEVNLNVPEYVLIEAKPTAKPGVAPGAKPGGAGPAPAGFLPKGALTEKLQIKVSAAVAKVRKGQLVIEGVRGRGEVAGGRFIGSGEILRAFGGGVRASDLHVPLVQPRPVVTGELNWAGVVIERAVEFAKPEFKDFANGSTTGRAKFKTRLPEDPEFLNSLEAEGQAKAEPVTLNSVKIGEIINSSLGKIPGVNLPPVKVTPLHGLVSAEYNVRGGVADLPAVLARDADNSELNVKGKVKLSDLTGELKGSFAWANSPIKGCAAEANADQRGRIVIPLAIKGNLMNPGFAVVGDLITTFGARTAECEAKKAFGRASKDGLEGLKKEGGKLLKGLFGK